MKKIVNVTAFNEKIESVFRSLTTQELQEVIDICLLDYPDLQRSKDFILEIRNNARIRCIQQLTNSKDENIQFSLNITKEGGFYGCFGNRSTDIWAAMKQSTLLKVFFCLWN